ncbi:MAG: hypothetical protein AYK23_04540 [Candidatus Proteinoplasmatales archaeon SG8-5]|nr:MAG: hypothetical protein AYK23_04540 [Candidatus Proteinoplasmatales archaeon SG8-5]
MTQRPPPPPPDDYYHYEEPPRRRPKRRRSIGGILVPLAVLIVILVLLFSPLGDILFSNMFGSRYPAYADFTVIRTMNLYVSNGEIEYTLDIPKPVSTTGSSGPVQVVESVVPTPSATELTEYGTTWMIWSGTTTQNVAVQVTYDMTVYTQIWDITTEDSGAQGDIPQSLIDSQTGDEWAILSGSGSSTGQYRIWPSNPQIGNLAASITTPGAPVIDNVRAIYDYLRSALSYSTGSGGSPKGCLQTLSDGMGDCDDQSIVFCSLCRAAGIPAWLVFGGLYDGSTYSWGGHAWAEVYIPLASGGGEEVTVDIVNGEFLVRNCNRFQEWESDGVSEHLSEYYYLLSHVPTGGYPDLSVSFVEDYTGAYTVSSESVGWICGLLLAPTEE